MAQLREALLSAIGDSSISTPPPAVVEWSAFAVGEGEAVGIVGRKAQEQPANISVAFRPTARAVGFRRSDVTGLPIGAPAKKLRDRIKFRARSEA